MAKSLDKITQQDLRKSITRKCSDCPLRDECPFYDEDNNECVLDKKSNISLKDNEDLVNHMRELMEMGRENLLNLQYQTKIAGVGYNPEITKMIEAQVRILKEIKELMSRKDKLTISAEGQGAQGVFSKIFLNNNGGDS